MNEDEAVADGPPGLARIGAVSEGGLSARHVPRRSLPILVAPSTGEDTFNTLRMPLTPIACWRLNDARFGFDSSFIHPEAQEEFLALASLTDSLKDAPLSVFGHADPIGSDEYNKKLSGRRATAVYAVLVRRVDLWESLFSEPFGGDDWREGRWLDLMFSSLGYNVTDPADVRRFQNDNRCMPDGIIGHETRHALFGAYMDLLCAREGGDPLKLEVTRFLGQGSDPHGKADFQGCSDFNNVLVLSGSEEAELKKAHNRTRRDNAHSANRRVLIYAFPPGTVVTAADWPCPTASASGSGCRSHFWPDAQKRREPGPERRTFQSERNTFGCRFYHRLAMRSPCEKLMGANRVRFNLVDYMDFPLPETRCFVTIEGAYRDARTTAEGRAEMIMPDGDYAVMMESGTFVTFGGEYAFYRHDQVAELSGASNPAQPLLPASKNGRANALPLDDLLSFFNAEEQ